MIICLPWYELTIMHMFRFNQVLLLIVIPFRRQTRQECRMAHDYAFFVVLKLSSLEVRLEKFPQLEASLIHFQWVLHPIRELVICYF